MVYETTLRARWSCVFMVFTSIALALLPLPLAAQTSSNVRIVRLSFVEGTVSLQRPDVSEWAKASVNTPIQQGFELATDANSFAEVEFENGSTARLGQTTSVKFTELSLGSGGNKINRMTLSQGYATFTVSPERNDLYEITTPQGTFVADDKSAFRIDLGQNDARLEVFKGEVQAQSPSGGGTVAKNDVLEINPGAANAYEITRGITLDAWDRWVEQRNNQATPLTAARNSPVYQDAYASQYSSMYGWNDLAYYGNWNYLPGYGYGWTPYVSSGWMPYTLGRWSYYPGFGYTWISGLPWGWLPFHYGNWAFMSGFGWCWLPGNLGYWSPGVVNWYQGPGWVGWFPRTGGFGSGGFAGCQAGLNCTTAVSLNTFRSGGFVSPNTLLRVDPAQGSMVTSPRVNPTRFARLPGPVVRRPGTLSGTENVRTSVRTAVVPSGTSASGQALVTRSGTAPTTVFSKLPGGFGMRNQQGIVFNPETRQYENGSASPARQNLRQQTTQLPLPKAVERGSVMPSRTDGPNQPGGAFAPGRDPSPASSLSTTPIVRQAPPEHNKVAPAVAVPNAPYVDQNGWTYRSSRPSERPSARETFNNRSNSTLRNDALREQQMNRRNERLNESPQMNRGSSNTNTRVQPSRQPSGGFGGGGMRQSPSRSMEMPSRGGGLSGGGAGGNRGGGGGSQGPHR